MQRLIVSIAASVCLVALLGAGSPAHAAFATFVSGNGLNSNDCLTPETACRQISGANGALSKTDPGGTIAVLAGDYDAFTIGEAGKQVDVIGQGGVAMVASQLLPVPGGGEAAVLVNVDGAGNMPIRIHGLTISAGGGGIVILGNSPEVDIQDCSISGLGPNFAVDFRPSQTGELYITNTVISRSVGSGSGGGVRIAPTNGAGAQAVFDNARFENNVIAILIDGRSTTGSITTTVRNSVVSGSNVGFNVIDNNGVTDVMLEQTSVTANGVAIRSQFANAVVRLRDSTVTGNPTGLRTVSGGRIISHGGNVLVSNTINGAFTQTAAQQ